MNAVLRVALAFLLAQPVLHLAPAAAGAQATVPGGGSLLDWLGLEPGDRLTYRTMDGERLCVEVGEPLALAGRRHVPLVGLSWPGLATDSQVFVPLDGTLGLGVIRTPTLRPHQDFDWLLDPVAPRFLPRAVLGEAVAVPGDGWYAIGDSSEAPTALLYVWCIACVDAGTHVWMERGRGITRVEERTITGPRRISLVGEGCDAAEVELEVGVSPAPERRP